jgi:hypothetical protein
MLVLGVRASAMRAIKKRANEKGEQPAGCSPFDERKRVVR